MNHEEDEEFEVGGAYTDQYHPTMVIMILGARPTVCTMVGIRTYVNVTLIALFKLFFYFTLVL